MKILMVPLFAMSVVSHCQALHRVQQLLIINLRQDLLLRQEHKPAPHVAHKILPVKLIVQTVE
jgi:hypothetical protein